MPIQQGKTNHWVKSSHSGGNGACVEVKSSAVQSIAVRDSKVPAGPCIGFAPSAWSEFVGAVDAGDFESA